MNIDVVALANRLGEFKDRAEKARKTFGLSLTRKCHVACKHCINDSLPNRTAEVTPSQIRKLCQELAASTEFETVNMTGGEPFEVFELLHNATGIIASCGLRPTVVTSASWATSADTARNIMCSLAEQRLRALIVSRDEFHEPRVPAENVAYALRSAIEADVTPALNLTTGVGIKGFAELLEPIENHLSQSELKRVRINEVGLLRAGRASRLKSEKFGGEVSEELHPLVCNVNGPVLLESGEFTACCGIELPAASPLRRGHCDNTHAAEMVSAVRADPLVRMIRYLGLRRMAKLLGREWLEPNLESFIDAAQPADLCQVCVRLLANPDRVRRLREIAERPEINREMAITAALFYGDNTALEG